MKIYYIPIGPAQLFSVTSTKVKNPSSEVKGTYHQVFCGRELIVSVDTAMTSAVVRPIVDMNISMITMKCEENDFLDFTKKIIAGILSKASERVVKPEELSGFGVNFNGGFVDVNFTEIWEFENDRGMNRNRCEWTVSFRAVVKGLKEMDI